ncbi:hypothetical protein FOL47_007555 [Perkinsus chesapeaki]|uniref:RING-type domain-containing protein n=1 Tax=Perkinsus chesapeaki TaxID=330153 RepID=A0A7J6MVN0_PERCH|nr:hypothetical protein FOL47_007555 [Perkinsus chesapeaki]
MPPRRSAAAAKAKAKAKAAPAPAAPPPAPKYKLRYCDKDNISPNLHCSVCCEVFTDPICAWPCGHTFCQECLYQWLDLRNTTCPECRQTITRQNCHKDLMARKFLDEQDVYCPYRGCLWDGKHGDLEAHMGECDCDPRKVPDFLNAMSSLDEPEDESDEAVLGGALGMQLLRQNNSVLLKAAQQGFFNRSSSPSVDEILDDEDDNDDSGRVPEPKRARTEGEVIAIPDS